jgi:hypothetical protein
LSAILQHLPGHAQQTTADKIEGIWKGTSLGEVSILTVMMKTWCYNITKKSATLYKMQASKIVNGAEEDMGTFDSVLYDETKQTPSFTMKDNQGRNAVWLFKLAGIQMHGTLTINENTLFRIVGQRKVDTCV